MTIYNVSINPAKEENRFLVTWHNVNNHNNESFEISAPGMFSKDIPNFSQQSVYQLDIGQKLFAFLDGDARHLLRALHEAHQAGELLQLHLFACKQVADWPFELLAQENSFLLPNELHLIRRVSDRGKAKEMPPGNRPLKMLFMACSPIDIKPELEFEREEETIFKVTEKLAIDMEVEDSGSLEGLKERLVQEKYDVVHLSGHAYIDESAESGKKGQSFFVMEDEIGHRCDITAEELWNKALIENPPRLLFLSGCHTARAIADNDDNADVSVAQISFAQKLLEKYDIPAVLGWGHPVNDEQAICAEEILYRELSRGKSILDALQRARYELKTKFQTAGNPAWAMLRLFSDGLPLNAIVTEGQPQKIKPRKLVHIYLEQSRVKVLQEGFVGRRRQLQQSLRALKQTPDKIGILLLGTGGLGKSCLTGKLNERFKDHTLIVIHGKLEEVSLKAALKNAFLVARDEKAKQMLDMTNNMTEILENLYPANFKEKNYLLLLDDFEQNFEGAEKGQPGSLLPEAAKLLMSLLHYLPYSGKMTQLIITSRYDFSLTEMDGDLIEKNLQKIWLTSFPDSEQYKKTQTLHHIWKYKEQECMKQLIGAGWGNPGLMDCIDRLVGKTDYTDFSQLQEIIKTECKKFINEQKLKNVLQHGGSQLELLLKRLSIYRRPVSGDGLQIAAKKAGIEEWEKLVQQGMKLSLIEYDEVHKAYRLTPLLREDFLAGLEETASCHEAAFEYYKKKCEARELIEPILLEEWIYHALGCGQEKTASIQGYRLITYLREKLTFRESRRIGEWILAEKKQALAHEYDAVLLNEIAVTMKTMGHHDKAVQYWEQALQIDRSLFGEYHPNVMRDLNNLGSALRVQHGPGKALEYFEQARQILHALDDEGLSDQYLDITGNLFNNLGTVWDALGNNDKALVYYKKTLDTWKKMAGEKNANIAIVLNNLGAACNRLQNYQEAAEYFNQALSIDRSVYGKMHFEVATDLNNLGAVSLELQDHNRALYYLDEALTIWRQIYGTCHTNIAVTLSNMAEAYLALGQREKAKEYFEQSYHIFKEIVGATHSSALAILNKINTIAAAGSS